MQILSNPTNRSEEPSLVENPTLLLDLEEESTQLHGEADLEVVAADGNCYESIDGVVDVGKAFCSRFPSTSSGKLLNMFSTVDHSKFCIAHMWTYRDLDVVGLADSPTEVRSKNFEISKTKVPEWLTLPVLLLLCHHQPLPFIHSFDVEWCRVQLASLAFVRITTRSAALGSTLASSPSGLTIVVLIIFSTAQ